MGGSLECSCGVEEENGEDVEDGVEQWKPITFPFHVAILYLEGKLDSDWGG